MACPVNEVNTKNLRSTHFEQLLFYINHVEEEGIYYGRQDYYEQRHADLKEWVEGIVDLYDKSV